MRSQPHWPMTRAACIALLAVTASGCGEPAGEVTADVAIVKPDPPPRPPSPWSLEASATAGAALVFSDPDGVERLRLICRRAPAQFVVQAPDVKPIGSEERFTLGFGNQLFTLVADVADSQRPFVEATGPLTPDLIAALRSGRRVAANYGAVDIGPLPAPFPGIGAAFAEACEAARGS